jgi:hypothetical protein
VLPREDEPSSSFTSKLDVASRPHKSGLVGIAWASTIVMSLAIAYASLAKGIGPLGYLLAVRDAISVRVQVLRIRPVDRLVLIG